MCNAVTYNQQHMHQPFEADHVSTSIDMSGPFGTLSQAELHLERHFEGKIVSIIIWSITLEAFACSGEWIADRGWQGGGEVKLFMR